MKYALVDAHPVVMAANTKTKITVNVLNSTNTSAGPVMSATADSFVFRSMYAYISFRLSPDWVNSYLDAKNITRAISGAPERTQSKATSKLP